MKTKQDMIENDLKRRGIRDPRVLEAFETVDRADFVLEGDGFRAYDDNPLPIGFRQTISQPYIVALTVESLELNESDTVLELGTGSGFEAAVLSVLCGKVYTVERIPELADRSVGLFNSLGYDNIEVITGDGSVGLPGRAPFEAIAVSAAAPVIPESLVSQLSPGGRMVIPVGQNHHRLMLVRKHRDGSGFKQENICDCRFVPLIGKEAFPG